MPRRQPQRSASFDRLGPLDTPIPISTGTAEISTETDGSVLLQVNGVPSSHLHPDPEHLVFEYMRWMMIVITHHLEGDRMRPGGPAERAPSGAAEGASPQIAHLGGAGCSLPRAIASRFPRSRQIVVELDALLAERVREWFDLPRSPQLRIRVDDAAAALAAWRDDRFDVLVRDVFAGDTTPRSLIGSRAAQHAARVLKDGGIYLANCAAPPGTRLLADELATLSLAFPHVGVIAEPAHLSGKRRGNCVLMASSRPLPEGVDRALRSDAVSVRLARPEQVEQIRRSGRVLEDG